MSTIKTTNLQHPSAASPNLVLAADGSVSGGAGLGGLVLVSPTSIANSGGSASASGGAVTFTGVSSVSLNGVFSSTYDNYLLKIRANTNSAAAGFQLRYRTSGTDNSSSIYSYTTGRVYSATLNQTGSNTSTYWEFNGGTWDADINSADLYLFNPNKVENTTGFGLAQTYFSSNATVCMTGCIHRTATAFDGFSLFASTGTITGTIRVYGYRNS